MATPSEPSFREAQNIAVAPWPQKAPQKAEEITEAGEFFFYFFVSENILNILSMCSLGKLDEQLPGTEH